MVSGGLALTLDENWNALGVLSIPSLEWLKDLETVTGWADGNADGSTVSWRSLVGVTAWVVAIGWQTLTGWRSEHELVSVLVLELVGQWVKVKGTGDGESNNEVGRSDEGVGGRVGIVTASEVTVVRGDDRVGFVLLDVLTIPLANARTTGVGKDNTAEFLEGLELTVTLDGGTNLLGSGGHGEERLGLDAVVESITGNGSSAGHILVGGVGARSNETDLELRGPVVFLNGLLELGDGGSKVRGERTVDVWL